ncbi:hypothetical protein LEP1GSC008_0793 [Leptospira kirschneri serovar Bulgarica str. Nikolaevo]|uniref:Uncharacterized protein n=1 Tax=Leptospira kirschneri serovar Bulgarica str. Nikolaevo TaxID=1240687 RepID=M6F522_9LEPT|nr:hypothetical protein LEP1GSC008_0793 [Leptospira kirschneri serovar Bulgarica str. Nikolaevo]
MKLIFSAMFQNFWSFRSFSSLNGEWIETIDKFGEKKFLECSFSSLNGEWIETALIEWQAGKTACSFSSLKGEWIETVNVGLLEDSDSVLSLL